MVWNTPSRFAVALCSALSVCSWSESLAESSKAAAPLPGEKPSSFVDRIVTLKLDEDALRATLQAAADHYGSGSFGAGVSFLDALPGGDASLGAFMPGGY